MVSAVTIRDVARRAGVSTATVSYVLNDSRPVGKETRRRVLQAAKELGYRPSVIARGLRFFIVAALLWKFGAPIRDFIERRLGLMFTLFVVLLAGGFYVVKYL